MTPYKNMTKTERKELRAFLECQFRKIGYLIGIRTDGAWIATPLGEGEDLVFKDIFDAEKFIEDNYIAFKYS